MFVQLNNIYKHPVYQLSQIPYYYIVNSIDVVQFSDTLVPNWFRPILNVSPKLFQKFEALHNALHEHERETRETIYALFQNHNRIQQLCEDPGFVLHILPVECQNIHDRLKTLMRHLFRSTMSSSAFMTAVGGRGVQDHYLCFRKINDLRVCPFCGIENYTDIGAGRAQYDHYLNISRYPAAGVNFRNLVPMCNACNEGPNKHSQDIIHFEGTRRRAYYPYGVCSGVQLQVQCVQQPYPGDLGVWNVEIVPNVSAEQEQIDTWNMVFNLRERLASRVGNAHRAWLTEFFTRFYEPEEPPSVEAVRQALADWALKLSIPAIARMESESLLKHAYFEYMASAPEPIITGLSELIPSHLLVEFAARRLFEL